jgi:hypothetical protein
MLISACLAVLYKDRTLILYVLQKAEAAAQKQAAADAKAAVEEAQDWSKGAKTKPKK